MKKAFLGIIFITTGLNIVGCGSSGDSSDPDQNTTAFKFFPEGFFVAGYREEYDFNGIRINADNNNQLDVFTNNPVDITQPESVFNLTSVIPVFEVGEISFSNGTESTPSSVTRYYSINNNDRRFLGDITVVFGITNTSIAVSTTPIPVEVNIGDSGNVGTYLDSFGSRYIIDWNVSDEGNNQARLTWTTSIENAASGIEISEREDIFIIDVNGNRISKKINFETFTLSPNFIDNWTGVKIP